MPESPASRLPQQLPQTCGSGLARDDFSAAPVPNRRQAGSHNKCLKPVGAGLPAMISALRQYPNRRQAGSHNSCLKPVAAGLPAMISALRQYPIAGKPAPTTNASNLWERACPR